MFTFLNAQLQSRVPQRVELGFRSPYGDAVADLVVRFDTCNRVLKTLVRGGTGGSKVFK